MMKLGEMKIHVISDGEFRLDGGAMFGVVPRALWEKVSPPDGKNRVRLGLNCILVEAAGEVVLLDTGIGDKGDEKFDAIFGVKRKPTLTASLRGAGFAPEDVTLVVNTHLHFDHAGGNTREEGGRYVPAFPRARYVVQAGELEAARDPNERTSASYRPDDFEPVLGAGLLETVEGDTEVAPGVRVERTGGHSRDIQVVRIDSGGQTAVFLTDIIPTIAHLRYPYIPGYDLFPLETLEAKKRIVEEAAEKGWLLFFYHDPQTPAARVSLGSDGPVAEPAER